MSTTTARVGKPSPLSLLHRACQRIDDLFLANVGDRGVTPRQYAVMRMLAAQKDVSQTDISDATGIDRSTLADIVRRLVGKGLVQRKRTKTDARTYAVRLTDAGREAVASSGTAARSADSNFLSPLNAGEREQFLAMLERVVAGKEARAAAGPKQAAKARRAAD